MALLRAEIEASTGDRTRAALLHYELGRLFESGAEEAQAAREYLSAFNLDPRLRPALDALVTLFERRRSFKNLVRLYEAEARVAGDDAERASAMLDRAALLEDRMGQPDAAAALVVEALALHPSAAVALAAERIARRAADPQAIRTAMEARANAATDPTERAVLLVDLAAQLEALGDVDEALATCRRAAELASDARYALEQLERIARRHGRDADLAEALERQGRWLLELGRMPPESGESAQACSPEHERAVALLAEAADLHARRADVERANAALELALRAMPDDPGLHWQRLLVCELASDTAGVAVEAAWLLENAERAGPFASVLAFRRTEHVHASGDVDAAIAQLQQIVDADVAPVAAGALLEDLLLETGNIDAVCARLELAATDERRPPAARAQELWRAAQLAADALGDFPRARGLYLQAAQLAADPAPVLRELLAASLRHAAPQAAREAAERLLQCAIDPEEAAAVARDLHELLRSVLEDHDAADRLLEAELKHPRSVGWAPDVARLLAASRGDNAGLARAHEALAARESDESRAMAHLCAAARAHVRAGALDAAAERLRAVLARQPAHGYALAMLEEIHRRRGEAEEVVRLLREASEARRGSRAAEVALLLAGAEAEAAGDEATASASYEQAAEHDPTSLAPLVALDRLARRTGDRPLRLRALEALAERELAAATPGRFHLELGELYAFGARKPELAEDPLRAALDSDASGASAAIALLLPGRDAVSTGSRIAAARRLLAAAPASDFAQRLLLLEAVGVADAAAATEAASALLARAPDDPLALLARSSIATPPTEERATWLLTLGRATAEPQTKAGLLLAATRAAIAAGNPQSSADAYLVATELAESVGPRRLEAATALEETAVDGSKWSDDRLEALDARAANGPISILAASGRARLAAGRHAEAAERLRRVVDAQPDDLASWESLRVAARGAQRWNDVVEACDVLAAHVDGEARAQLLEEAAQVLMDELGDEDGAARRLREALAVDVRRPIAWHRLHDLLGARGETSELLELVDRRIDATDDPDELARLFYEQARLRRARGDLDGALASLRDVLALDETHVGALALEAEIHKAAGRPAEAVAAFRRLAAADIPPAQRRLAHLAAAAFLEKELADPAGAVRELEAIEALGLGDAALTHRIADLAERAGLDERALQALRRAAPAHHGRTRAEIERRAGRIAARLGRRDEAVDALRRALAEVPTDVESAEALVALLEPADRRATCAAFEAAVRVGLDADPLDAEALRRLRRVAAWTADADLEYRVLGALVVSGRAEPSERHAHDEHERTAARTPSGRLSEATLAELGPGPRSAVLGNAIDALSEIAAEVWPTSLDALGVGRDELVPPRQAHPLRDEIAGILAAFGAPPLHELYVGGADAVRLSIVSGRKGPIVVVGRAVSAPLTTALRWSAGREAWGIREGLGWLAGRPLAEVVELVRAALLAAGVPVSAGPPTSALVGRIEKASSRRTRRALAEAAQREGAGALEGWIVRAWRGAARAGLLAAGSLRAALDAAGLAPGDVEGVELVRFWTSQQAAVARRELGFP
ncbi:MAG: hypothetical protein RMK74_01190 [Myxococcales bacterium]|nr:hypothetical protein [Myxococcales bacterium]